MARLPLTFFSQERGWGNEQGEQHAIDHSHTSRSAESEGTTAPGATHTVSASGKGVAREPTDPYGMGDPAENVRSVGCINQIEGKAENGANIVQQRMYE
uniref:Uncharacterized protein n=1 Tax=Mycena chlorophos TaxID=658473 RepID=A0ABQ0LP17_MYCCL|nr:predicted protein [Mycena chlorophos]